MINKNKGFATIAILGIILGVLIIGGGAYYIGTNKNVEKEKMEDIKNIENMEKDNQYLTYIEKEQFGFQFNYLKDKFVKDYKNPIGETVYIADCPTNEAGCEVPKFVIEINSNIKNENDLKKYLEDRTNDYLRCPSNKPVWEDNSKIDNQKSIQVNRVICGEQGSIKYPLPILGTIYNSKAYILNFQKGEYIGDEKKEFDNLVSSFNFIDIKDPNLEFFNGNPGEIKSLKTIIKEEYRTGWELGVDILSDNPKWEPGNDEELYLNESMKIRKLIIDEKTESYECGNSVSGDIIPSIKNTSSYVENLKIGDIKSFYVTGFHVDKISDICLP